jgi:hypothetical protein
MTPYFERQVAGNCRVHSLNALFGRSVITPQRLTELSGVFDAEYGHVVTEQFDCVKSDSLMLVSYILERQTKYVTHYIPLGACAEFLKEVGVQDLTELFDPIVPAFMCFNAGHIWTVRKHKGEWWSLDSLQFRARRLMGPRDGFNPQIHGVLLVFTPSYAERVLLPLYQSRVCGYLRAHSLSSGSAISGWIAAVQRDKELGDLETALCSFFRVYRRAGEAPHTVIDTHYAQALSNVREMIVPLVELVVHYTGHEK